MRKKKETVLVLCKCFSSGKDRVEILQKHTKEVQGEGWVKLVCKRCGQSKYEGLIKSIFGYSGKQELGHEPKRIELV